jgi:hypothetical protein
MYKNNTRYVVRQRPRMQLFDVLDTAFSPADPVHKGYPVRAEAQAKADKLNEKDRAVFPGDYR